MKQIIFLSLLIALLFVALSSPISYRFTANMLERFNEEIKRRTHIVRIFPNQAACKRLVRALAAEKHEEWLEDHRYLNMTFLKETKKARLLNLSSAA